MKVCRKTIGKNLRYLLLFLLIITFEYQVLRANELSYDAVAQRELTAKNLSKIWSDETIRRSISLYRETAENWELLGERRKASSCLRESAKLSQLISNYENALTALNKALQIDRKDNYSEGKVISLSLLSLVSRQKGDIKNSENYYRQALELNKTSPTDLSRSYALFSAGMYSFYYGDIKKTINFFEQAISFAEKTDDIHLITQTLFYIGFSYGREGNPMYGLQQMKKALKICQDFHYLRGQALSYFGIGFLSMLMDEKQTALEAYKQAEAMFPQDFEWLERAKLYNNIAVIHEDYGSLPMAEIYRERAFEFYQKADYPYGQLASLPSLARLKYLKGDGISGKKLYDEALVLAKNLNDSFHLAIIKEGLGNLNFQEEAYENAIKNYQTALQVYQKLKIKLPRVEGSLGKAFAKKGDFVNARKNFNSALKTNLQIKDMFLASENLYNLAKLNHDEGNLQISLEQITESLRITENSYSNISNSKLQSNYLSNVFDRYELYIKLLFNFHRQFPERGFDIKALQAAEKSRARSMLEKLNLSEANFNKDANPETVKREKEIRNLLNIKADKLTDALSANANKTEIQKLSDEINEMENALEQIKADLKQNSPIYSAIKNPPPFDTAVFQNRILDDKTLLLEFSFGKEESFLWLVGKDFIESYELPAREKIESRIEKLRMLIDSRQMLESENAENYQARISAAETEFEHEAQIFSNELLGQIAEKIIEKRLIIVPDGKLHYFPVAALPFPGSNENQPILVTNETIYQPSAATLLLLTQTGKKSVATPKNLLVFADPIFSTQDARIAATQDENQTETSLLKTEKFRFAESLITLSRLNASQEEAYSIMEIVGASDSTVFAGAAATRENAMDAGMADYKIVHFATHGLINEERPELSGIVLSQVNENGNNQNGVVRLQDIYAMNLTADLVVLSACSTGIGKEVKGEGLMSLNNAFLQTGAKTVISSLWKVDDYATRELMKNFYRELTSGTVTTSEALRRAQIKMRQNPQYQSPFYWAAFTVQGDFQTAPKLSGGFGLWIYTFLIVPFSLVGIYAYRRRFKLLNRKIVSKN